MEVRMKTFYASATAACSPRGVIDLPAAEARALIEGGYAVAVSVEATGREVRAGGAAASSPQPGAKDDLTPPAFLNRLPGGNKQP